MRRWRPRSSRTPKVFLLCNPHNPVGRAYTREELEKFADLCARHDLLLCADEIHADLLLGGTKHIPAASLAPEIAARTVTLMAPSKTFNLPGLGCGFAIIQDVELRKQFNEAMAGIVPHVNVFGYTGALAAYAHPDSAAWLDHLRAHLTQNRDFLVSYIEQELPQLRTTVPEATYLAWIDCADAGIEGDLQTFFVEQGKVAFNPGPWFGEGGEGFVRLEFRLLTGNAGGGVASDEGGVGVRGSCPHSIQTLSNIYPIPLICIISVRYLTY